MLLKPPLSTALLQMRHGGSLVKLTTWFDGEQHHFLLKTGEAFTGQEAGVWASYRAPRYGQKGVVEMLYATKESRHYVPSVLGVLAIHALKLYRELPEGSHNLSPHSLGIQRRLASLLGQLPADAAINSENWFSSLWHVYAQHRAQEGLVQGLEPVDLTYTLTDGKKFVLDVLQGRLPE